MYALDNITSHAKQLTKWVNGDLEVEFTLEYKDNQLGWYLGVKYKDVNYKNIRITTTCNLLRSYSNYMPFGLMCLTENGQEPLAIDDFTSGYAMLYVLTREECKQIEDSYYAKIQS